MRHAEKPKDSWNEDYQFGCFLTVANKIPCLQLDSITRKLNCSHKKSRSRWGLRETFQVSSFPSCWIMFYPWFCSQSGSKLPAEFYIPSSGPTTLKTRREAVFSLPSTPVFSIRKPFQNPYRRPILYPPGTFISVDQI